VVLLESEATDTKLGLSVFILANGEIVAIDNLANRRDVEEAEVVAETDEEHSVVLGLMAYLLEKLGRPQGRRVAPVPMPFLQAPRVSDLYQSNGFFTIF